MKHYFQPKGSSTCGQHCVAIVADITPEESIRLFGKISGTTTKQVHEVFNKLGIKTTDRLSRINKKSILPGLCILKIVYSRAHSHWVVYSNGTIYCPCLGIYKYSDHEYLEIGKPTSFLEINK